MNNDMYGIKVYLSDALRRIEGDLCLVQSEKSKHLVLPNVAKASRSDVLAADDQPTEKATCIDESEGR